MADKQYTDRLSKTLINYVTNLVDGNNANAKDVIDKGYIASDATISLYAKWSFSAETNDGIYPGNRVADRHFGYNQKKFKEHSQNLVNDANYDKELRADFLKKLNARGAKAIIDASKATYVVHNFSTFSYHFDCTSCHGKGRVRCYSCSGSGRNYCYVCSGSGSIGFQEQVYRNGQPAGSRWSYKTCNSCFGSGQITCSGCGGGGIVNCRSCSGHGFFTKRRDISGIASTSYSIGVASNVKGIGFRDYLLDQDLRFCYDNFDFERIKSYESGSNKHEFLYKAQTLIIEHNFEILNYIYVMYTYANLEIFINAYFFNELLDEQINSGLKLKSISLFEKKRLLAQHFESLKSIQVLNDSMQEIAKSKHDRSVDSSKVVLKNCKYHLSTSHARSLSYLIEKSLDKVSPTYSKTIWSMFALIGILYTFIYAVYISEYSSPATITQIGTPLKREILTSCTHTAGECWAYANGLPITSSQSAFKSLLILTFLGFIAGLLSKLSTKSVSKNLPEEYKQLASNRRPFFYFICAGFIAYCSGTVYGYKVHENSLPSLNGIIIEDIEVAMSERFSPVCSLKHSASINPNKSLICDMLSAEYYSFRRKTNGLSEKDKVIFVQQFLKDQGHEIDVDGIRGVGTNTVINKYMASKEKEKTNTSDLYISTEDIYLDINSEDIVEVYYEEFKEDFLVKHLSNHKNNNQENEDDSKTEYSQDPLLENRTL